jgi:two-component system OmpR family response regulator
LKILLIDDEPDLRRIATLSLSRIGGMEVRSAGNPVQGIAMAAEELPDVILLDVMMPDLDGPQVLARLRSMPATRHVPVIFLTANALPAEVSRLRGLGAAGVLTKPFDTVVLPDDVRRIFASAGEADGEQRS